MQRKLLKYNYMASLLEVGICAPGIPGWIW